MNREPGTGNYELWIMNYELWIMNYELWIMNYELWIMNYELNNPFNLNEAGNLEIYYSADHQHSLGHPDDAGGDGVLGELRIDNWQLIIDNWQLIIDNWELRIDNW